MDPSNKDSVIEATSSFIVELGELDATTRKADVAMLKSFLTRDVDEYRAPYGRKREAYPRRTIYGATVNPSEFLVDQTGNRRFWLMPCASIVQDAEVDMQQVWAEACVLAQTEGHWMPGEFKSEQQELAKCFAKRSPWADDFYSRFRHPTDEDMVPPRISVASIRAAVDPHRNWNQADMSSFTAFLRGEGFDMGVQRGVMHARVVGL
jgi:putative DNA primase/helicase